MKIALLLCPLLILMALLFVIPQSSGDAASEYPSQFCLRDEYFLGLEDQNDFGNCWAFANLHSIENVLAQKTGEHFELADGYVALTRSITPAQSDYQYSETLIGAGGSVNDFVSAINSNGFVLESDAPYQDFYFANQGSYAIMLENYKKFADLDTINISKLESADYSNNRGDALKKYLMQNGNASVNISGWDILTRSNGTFEIVRGTSGAHALCVIGWDDDYRASNGTSGAYIILNSYGILNEVGVASNDGILYLPYRCALAEDNCAIFSYVCEINDDYVTLSSNASYTLDTAGKYYSSTNYVGAQTVVKEQNIFDVDDEFELEYTFPDRADLQYEFDIYRGENNVSDDFYILKDDTKCYVYRKNDLQSGSYKVDINFSYTRSGRQQKRHFVKQLCFLDGLEFGMLEAYGVRVGNTAYEIPVVANSFSLAGTDIDLPQFVALNNSTRITFSLAMSPFAKLTNYALKYGASTLTGQPSTKLPISFTIPVSQAQTNVQLTLQNEKHQKTYNIHIQFDKSTEQYSTLLDVDLEGGEIEKNYPSQILLNSSSTFSRYYFDEVPEKEGYIFEKFQYRDAQGQWKDLPYMSISGQKRYFATVNNALRATSNNYFTYSLETGDNYYKTYLFVKAVYVEDSSAIVKDDGTVDYGQKIKAHIDGVSEQITWLVDGQEVGKGQSVEIGDLMPGNYVLTAKYSQNGTNFEKKTTIYVKNHVFDVSYDKIDFVYDKTVQRPNVTVGLDEKYYSIDLPQSVGAGDYAVTITPISNNIRLKYSKIDYTIAKRDLVLSFDSQLIEEMNGKIEDITYHVEGWCEEEELAFEFDTSAANTSVVGDYPVTYRITNQIWQQAKDNYNCIVNEEPYIYVMFDFDAQVYDIVASDANRVQGQTFAYGQNFVLSFDCPQGLIEKVEYTIDNDKTYSIKQQFVLDKFSVGTHTVVGKATFVNGAQVEKTMTINVVKAKIKIVLDEQTGEVGKPQKELTYTIKTDYANYSLPSDVVITPTIVGFDENQPGDYVITARVEYDKNNYEIELVDATYHLTGEGNVNLYLIIGLVAILFWLAVAMILRAVLRKNKRKKSY